VNLSLQQRFLGTGAVRKGSEAGEGQDGSSEPEYSAKVSRESSDREGSSESLRTESFQRVRSGSQRVFGTGVAAKVPRNPRIEPRKPFGVEMDQEDVRVCRKA